MVLNALSRFCDPKCSGHLFIQDNNSRNENEFFSRGTRLSSLLSLSLLRRYTNLLVNRGLVANRLKVLLNSCLKRSLLATRVKRLHERNMAYLSSPSSLLVLINCYSS